MATPDGKSRKKKIKQAKTRCQWTALTLVNAAASFNRLVIEDVIVDTSLMY